VITASHPDMSTNTTELGMRRARTHPLLTNAMASSRSFTGTMGNSGPKISLSAGAAFQHCTPGRGRAGGHALGHERVGGGHVLDDRRRDVLFALVGAAAKDDLPCQAKCQLGSTVRKVFVCMRERER
jgi:hypothetical protein